MRSPWLVRVLLAVLLLALLAWVATNTRWVEEEVDDPARGAAATDKFYSLRKLLQAAGSTLEVRTALEPLPPPGATLVLNSAMWDIFPERDARLKAWVESGGHLVVNGWTLNFSERLRWVPMSFGMLSRRDKAASAVAAASAAASAASAADDEDDEQDDKPAARPAPQRPPAPASAPARGQRWSAQNCLAYREDDGAAPAFERGRVYRSCTGLGPLRLTGHVQPAWELTHDTQVLAARVAIGRGTVTGVAIWANTDNRELLRGDDALVTAAILQAAPGHAVWLVDDEAREPLVQWLWHQTRTPLLLCAAAIALALWRLMARFGPLQAVPPVARRSMGEQVRGTGHFIAAGDMAALHAATRRAFDDAARVRVEGWNEQADETRIPALAAALAPAIALDVRALLDALHPGPDSTPAQWRSAIGVVEQARRALLRAATS